MKKPTRPLIHNKSGIFCACDPLWFVACWLCDGTGEKLGRKCKMCFGEGLLWACTPESVDVVKHRNVIEEVY
jgi:hypothetical protein